MSKPQKFHSAIGDDRVRRAIGRMSSALERKLTLDELSRHVGVGRFHFLRIFRRSTGRTPHAFLTRLRVEEARRLILEGHELAEVAQRVGFYDQSHLNHHFRRAFGTTPARFRKTASSTSDA